MTKRLADILAHIELAPGEPTLDDVTAEAKREVESALAAKDSPKEDINLLYFDNQVVSAKCKNEILRLPLDPDDAVYGKHFPAILKAKVTLSQGTENNVVRADEAVMRARVAEEVVVDIFALLDREREKFKLLA